MVGSFSTNCNDLMMKWWDEITNGGPDNTKFSIVVLRGSQKSWWDEIGVLFYLCLKKKKQLTEKE